MTQQPTDAPRSFSWEPQPAAAALIAQWVDAMAAANPAITQLSQRLRNDTGTRLIDWIDALWLPESSANNSSRQRLEQTGFRKAENEPEFWVHPAGIFPRIALAAPYFTLEPAATAQGVLAIRVDDVDDFAQACALGKVVCEGIAGSPHRTARLPDAKGPTLAAM